MNHGSNRTFYNCSLTYGTPTLTCSWKILSCQHSGEILAFIFSNLPSKRIIMTRFQFVTQISPMRYIKKDSLSNSSISRQILVFLLLPKKGSILLMELSEVAVENDFCIFKFNTYTLQATRTYESMVISGLIFIFSI